MPDKSESRHMEGRSGSSTGAAASGVVWPVNCISQTETFRDLTIAIAASLGVALLANLLALCI